MKYFDSFEIYFQEFVGKTTAHLLQGCYFLTVRQATLPKPQSSLLRFPIWPVGTGTMLTLYEHQVLSLLIFLWPGEISSQHILTSDLLNAQGRPLWISRSLSLLGSLLYINILCKL